MGKNLQLLTVTIKLISFPSFFCFMIHTKSINKLKYKMLADSMKSTKRIKKPLWTPLRWMFHKEIPLQRRDIFRDFTIEGTIKRALSEATVLLPDEKYWVANVEDYKKFLELDDTDKGKYIDDIYDCDDFAWRLMGKMNAPGLGAFASGTVWSETHAFNCFVDWNKDFYIIEPQIDAIELATKLKEQEDYVPDLVFF